MSNNAIRINSFKEIEMLYEQSTKAYLFGAGMIGRTYAYDFLRLSGFNIGGYFDSKGIEGEKVIDGKTIIGLDQIKKMTEDAHLFVTVNLRFQDEVCSLIDKMRVERYYIFDTQVFSALMSSICDTSDLSLWKKYHQIIDDECYLKSRFRTIMKEELNLDNPTSFNEKMQWLKIHDRKPEYTEYVDKHLVKNLVETLLGKAFVIPSIGVWDDIEDIQWESLPEKVVLKCTHDSGSTVIFDRRKDEPADICHRLEIALKTDFFWIGREWPYKGVKKRIIAEPYIGDCDEMIDYKFMCFNGKVEMLFVCTDRLQKTGLKVTFFDRNWNKLPFERHYPSEKGEITKPYNFEKMIEIAEILSKGIPFVRVDLYNVNGKIYFGEMTFFPGGGMEEFTPKEWDIKCGQLITVC